MQHARQDMQHAVYTTRSGEDMHYQYVMTVVQTNLDSAVVGVSTVHTCIPQGWYTYMCVH